MSHVPSHTAKPPVDGERGFGMIEIIISMLLLGLLAMFFLPVLITTLQVSSTNSTMAVAAQLASGQLEEARAKGTRCSELIIPAGSSVILGTLQANGENLEVRRVRGACPTLSTAYPTTISLQVEVWRPGGPRAIVQASTLILVTTP
jgi:prepilin-type N-terminal cleavage/methylation domain-containing protein